MDDIPKQRSLAIDAPARSASSTEPAFIARLDGAPLYYGFVVLDDVNVGGFTLGKITDWEAEPAKPESVRDCARRKSGGFGLGGLRSSILPRSQAHRDRQVGRVGRRILSANE